MDKPITGVTTAGNMPVGIPAVSESRRRFMITGATAAAAAMTATAMPAAAGIAGASPGRIPGRLLASGRLVDADGIALAGATVRIWPVGMRRSRNESVTRTDADGRFLVDRDLALVYDSRDPLPLHVWVSDPGLPRGFHAMVGLCAADLAEGFCTPARLVSDGDTLRASFALTVEA